MTTPDGSFHRTDFRLLFVGVALLLVPLGFAMLEPAQFSTVRSFLRIISSLGGGLVGIAIPGLLNIQSGPIKATGAIALVVLFFKFDPPAALNEQIQSGRPTTEAGAASTHPDAPDGALPPKANPGPKSLADPPKRLVVSQVGKVHRSIAYWAGHANHAEWECIKAPAGFDFVVAHEEEHNIGQRRGMCVGEGSYCDSLHEDCGEVVITDGCFVNQDWHEWYKANTRRLGLPYSRSAVCEPDPPPSK